MIRIKRGATLSLTVAFASQGEAFPLTGVTLNAQLRDAEFNLVATLEVKPAATAGQATIYVQDTSAWPEIFAAGRVRASARWSANDLRDVRHFYRTCGHADDAGAGTL